MIYTVHEEESYLYESLKVKLSLSLSLHVPGVWIQLCGLHANFVALQDSFFQ